MYKCLKKMRSKSYHGKDLKNQNSMEILKWLKEIKHHPLHIKIGAPIFWIKHGIYCIYNIPTPSYGGSRYVLTFIDDFSRYCWVYFLELKYKVFETLKVWKALVENACGDKIKVLRTDNGKAYVNKILQHLCE